MSLREPIEALAVAPIQILVRRLSPEGHLLLDCPNSEIIQSRGSLQFLLLNLVCQFHSAWLAHFVGVHTDQISLHVVGAIFCS